MSTENVVGREQKSYEILWMEIFATLDKKDPNK